MPSVVGTLVDVYLGGIRRVAEHVCLPRMTRVTSKAALSPVRVLSPWRLQCRPAR